MLKSKKHLLVCAAVALVIAGGAVAAVVKVNAVPDGPRIMRVPKPAAVEVVPLAPTTAQAVAKKITAFKPGDAEHEAKHFNFENYSFTSLDDAVRRLFPAGTKMSYVDKVLEQQGHAKKSDVIGAEFVHYDYRFKADRFDCVRTVFVNFNAETQDVITAQGVGHCQ